MQHRPLLQNVNGQDTPFVLGSLLRQLFMSLSCHCSDPPATVIRSAPMKTCSFVAEKSCFPVSLNNSKLLACDSTLPLPAKGQKVVPSARK